MHSATIKISAALLLLSFCAQLTTCAHLLANEYRFSTVLSDGYTLHWSFDYANQVIQFAVNVSTTGWVGFGLSPNGQMPGSDVIIGWVNEDGTTQFADRYAEGRFLPSVDSSQDWFLLNGEEENGYTILEFSRNLTTCDENDLNIQADTARVIWAYHEDDPVGMNFVRHQRMGSVSLNLLGGNPEVRVEQNSRSFAIKNINYTIPDSQDTTYWCSVHRLPNEVAQAEQYIYKFAPVISAESTEHVHHILVYHCNNLDESHEGEMVECDNADTPIATCRGATVLAAWAVGGNEFVFPRDVALPIGGPSDSHYVLLEMHYDNPNLRSGVLDSSGIVFTYTSTPSLHAAGTLAIGRSTDSRMIVPPKTDNFIFKANCPGQCTKKFFPDEGITVFGNILHTHLIGHGLIVQHLRQNQECGRLEELKPIDENRRYDFNFQQITTLQETVQILPGDEIQLQCFYRTPTHTNVTLGGESTRHEMCVTFLYYYPRVDLSSCFVSTSEEIFYTFANQYLDPSLHTAFYENFGRESQDNLTNILRQVDWNEDVIANFEAMANSLHDVGCLNLTDFRRSIFIKKHFPKVDCSYVAPDMCAKTQVEPQGCCSQATSSNSETEEVPFNFSGATGLNVLHHVYLLLCALLAICSAFL